MRFIQKALLISLAGAASLMAEGYKLELAMSLDSNADQTYYPDIIIPLSWSDSLSSSVEYRSGERTDERETSELSVDEIIEHQRLKLNALNYIIKRGKGSYAFGLGGSYESYAKEQSGDYDSLALGAGTYTNNIDISVLSIYAKAEAIQRFDIVDLKTYALINPFTKLGVDQDTTFYGDTAGNITDSSNETTDLSYEIDINLISKTDTIVDFGFNANYRVLPLKYSLSGEDIDIEEKITRVQGNIYFNIKSLKEWMPTLAYSSETTDSDGDSYTEEKVYLGINTRF
jgi:hypothetical protein